MGKKPEENEYWPEEGDEGEEDSDQGSLDDKVMQRPVRTLLATCSV